MAEILGTETFSVMITFLLFYLSQLLYLKFKIFLFNPVLLTITTLIVMLEWIGIPYPQYNQGGKLISFFLGPAVVALAVPLHELFDRIKKKGVSILISLTLGSISGVVSVVIIAKQLGASREVIFSLAPKSVTTPIAMGIAEKLGGILPLTAGLVILTGILGAVLGPPFLKILGIKSPSAFGLAMGTAAHGIGTARAIEEGELQGAMSGLALGLNGILTSFLMPFIITLISAIGLL